MEFYIYEIRFFKEYYPSVLSSRAMQIRNF